MWPSLGGAAPLGQEQGFARGPPARGRQFTQDIIAKKWDNPCINSHSCTCLSHFPIHNHVSRLLARTSWISLSAVSSSVLFDPSVSQSFKAMVTTLLIFLSKISGKYVEWRYSTKSSYLQGKTVAADKNCFAFRVYRVLFPETATLKTGTG